MSFSFHFLMIRSTFFCFADARPAESVTSLLNVSPNFGSKTGSSSPPFPLPPILQWQWAEGRGGHCAILVPDGSHEPPVDRRQVRTPPSHLQGVPLATSRAEREITAAAQQRAAPVRRSPARRQTVQFRVPARDPVVIDIIRVDHHHSWFTKSLNQSR